MLAVASQHDREWSSRDQRMLVSIGQKVGQAVANSQKFSEAEGKVQAWETNYSAMQRENAQLTAQSTALTREVQDLRRIEQQIWIALAASQKAGKFQSEVLETWAKVLMSADLAEYGALFPARVREQDFTWAMHTGSMIQGLRETVAEGGYSLTKVHEMLGDVLEEGERWRDLAGIFGGPSWRAGQEFRNGRTWRVSGV